MSDKWWEAAPEVPADTGGEQWWESAPLAEPTAPAAPAAPRRPSAGLAIPPTAPLSAPVTRDPLLDREDKSTVFGDLSAGLKTLQTVPYGLSISGATQDINAGEYGVASAEWQRDQLAQIDAQIAELEKQLGVNGNPRVRMPKDQSDALQGKLVELRGRRNQIALAAGAGGPEASIQESQRKIRGGIESLAANLPGLIKLSREAAAIPQNPSAEVLGNSESLQEMWTALANDPTGVTRTFFLRSLPATAPTVIAALVGQLAGPTGAAALAGLVGGSIEMGTSVSQDIAEKLIENKVDPNDSKAVEAWALQNMPELLDTIAKARTRAAIIGTVDSATAGIGGRIASAVADSGLGRKVIGTVAGSAVETAGEGAGEASAQYATEGEIRPGEVAAEVIGAAPTGAAQSAGQIAIEAAKNRGKAPSVSTGETPPDVTAALTDAPLPDKPQATPAGDPTPLPADQGAALKEALPTATPRSVRDITKDIMGPPPTAAAPSAAPVTPPGNAEPAPASPEAAGDTVPTVPEAPATIQTQNEALLDPKNKRKAVLIPYSSYETGEVDEPSGKTIGQVPLPGVGVLFYNKAKGYTRNDILTLYKDGKLGTVLGLGEITKADAAKSAATGQPEVAVTERTPEGVEAKAAAGTVETAPEQVATLEAEKTPGNTVQVENPAEVLADRARAAAMAAKGRAAVDVAKARAAENDAQSQASPVRDRKDLLAEYAAKYNTSPSAQPSLPPSAAPAVLETPVQAVTQTEPQENALTKAEQVKQVSKSRSLTPAQRISEDVAAERRMIQEGQDRMAASRTKSVSTLEIDEEQARERADRGEVASIDEELAIRRSGQGKDEAREAKAVESARKTQQLLEDMPYDGIENVRTLKEAQVIAERLRNTLNEAIKRKIVIPNRLLPSHTNAQVWLSKMMKTAQKIDRLLKSKSASGQEAIKAEIADFLSNELLFRKTGDATGWREASEIAREGGDDNDAVADEGSMNPEEALAAKEEAALDQADDTTAAASEDFIEQRKPRTVVDPGNEPDVVGVTYDAEGKPITKKGPAIVAEVRKKRAIVKPGAKVTPKVTPKPETPKLPARPEDASLTLTNEEWGELIGDSDFLEEPEYSTFSEEIARFNGVNTKRLLNQLSDAAGKVLVKFVSDPDMDMTGGFGVPAFYTPHDHTITIRKSERDNPTRLVYLLLHEGTHAALVLRMRSDPILMKQAEAVLKLVRDHLEQTGDTDHYGLKNVDEFLAEAFSKSSFVKVLAKIKIPAEQRARWRKELGFAVTPKGMFETALDWLKVQIARVYRSEGVTAFDAAMKLAENILKADMAEFNRVWHLFAPGEKMPARAVNPMVVKLKDLGLNSRQADEVMKALKQHYDGKATDEQLEKIAEEILRVYDPAKLAAKAAKKQAAKISAAGKKLNDEAAAAVAKEFVPGKDPGRPWLLKLLTNSQIARTAERWFGEENNPVARLAKVVENRAVRKKRYLAEMSVAVSDIAAAKKDKKKYSKAQMEEFEAFVHDVTMAGVHPDVPLDHKKNAHLGKNALRGEYGKGAYPGLAKRWAALPEGLKKLYHDTRDTLTNAQDRMAYGLMRNNLAAGGFTDEAMVRRFHEGTATEQDYAMVGEELAHHIKRVSALKKIQGPYFSLMRRGSWVVRGEYSLTPPGNAKVIEPNEFEFATRKEATAYVHKMAREGLRADARSVWIDEKTGLTYYEDEEGQVKVSPSDGTNVFRVTVQNKHVEFVDSRREAKKLHKQLEDAGLKMEDFQPKKWEREAQNAEMLSDQYRAVMKTLDRTDTARNLTPQQRAALKAFTNEISLRFLGSTRIQSSRLPRRYVAGASKDLLRNTYDYVSETSGYLARLDTEPQIEAAVKELDDAVDAMSKPNKGHSTGLAEIRDEIEKRVLDPQYGDYQGPGAEAIKRLTTLSFIDNLASPGYSFVNAVSGAMMANVHLAGDFNPGAAARQLIKAYYDIGAGRTIGTGLKDTVKGFANVTATGGDYVSDIMSRLKEKRERDMIQQLADDGMIDAEGGLEVARMVEVPEGVGRIFDIPLDYAQNIFRAMPQAVEAVNRTVTALAAYRMMYAKTEDHAKSVKYAYDAVDMTQGNYSPSGTAPMFNSWAGRIALQFKKYSQMVVYFMARNVRRIIKNDKPGDRRKGIATMAYVLASQQLIAGTLGLPIEPLKLIMLAAHGLGLSDDDWEDFQKSVEEFYKRLTGNDKMAEALTYGVSRAIPVNMAFDLNSRTGWDSLITFGEPRSTDEQDEKAWLLGLVWGAPGSTVYDMTRGVREIAKGNVGKGLEKAIPLKIISDSVKAARGDYATIQERVLKAMGVNPASAARKGTENRYNANMAGKLEIRERELRDAYMAARTSGERTKIAGRIRDHNKELQPGSQYKINIETLEKKRQKEFTP